MQTGASSSTSTSTLTIHTPRVNVGKDIEKIKTWLKDILLPAIVSYCHRSAQPNFFVSRFVKQLEEKDASFLITLSQQLSEFPPTDQPSKRNEQLFAYLGIKSYPPDFSELERSYPLWMQKLLFSLYKIGEGILLVTTTLTLRQREEYASAIFKMTDIDAMKFNLKSQGGGRGRTPPGSFSEEFNQFFTNYKETAHPELKEILQKLFDLFAAVKGAQGTLIKYETLHGKPILPEESPRMEAPYPIQQQLEVLKTPEPHKKKPISSSTRERRQSLSSSSSSPPSIQRLPLDQISPSLPLAPSPRDVEDLVSTTKIFLKDVGTAIFELVDRLQISKANAISAICQSYQKLANSSNATDHLEQISNDYIVAVNSAFSSIEAFLKSSSPIDQAIETFKEFKSLLTMIVDHKQIVLEKPTDYIDGFEKYLIRLNSPLIAFGFDQDKVDLINFSDEFDTLITQLKETTLPLDSTDKLPTLVEKMYLSLERINARLNENVNGNAEHLQNFIEFFTRYESFQKEILSILRGLLLDYSLEKNLREAWDFIQQLDNQ